MFICFLAGGLGVIITIGIVDVLFVQAETQESVSRSVDQASGLCMLVFGALAGTPRLARSTGSSSWFRTTTGPGYR
jgi:hypothetical protein